MSGFESGDPRGDELDFEELIQRAAEIKVGEKTVYLRWPRSSVRIQMVKDARARDILDEKNEPPPVGSPERLEVTEFYHELCVRAMAECVITKKAMIEEDWDRVIRAADGNAVTGLAEVVQKAMELCGFGSVVKFTTEGETKDMTQEIQEGLGDDPSK